MPVLIERGEKCGGCCFLSPCCFLGLLVPVLIGGGSLACFFARLLVVRLMGFAGFLGKENKGGKDEKDDH